jgi:hypothetical protein
VWLLWPSMPQAVSTRMMKWSSPGRPTWYITSSLRSSSIAARMRPPMSWRASSQVHGSNWPEPRGPVRLSGVKMRSVSLTWLIVAGPLAQVRPREPGCTGLPSNFSVLPVSLLTKASRPQADSQLKQMVGMQR